MRRGSGFRDWWWAALAFALRGLCATRLSDLTELEETLSVLSDPQALADIREADAAYDKGEVIRGIDAVRALRP